MGTQSELYIRFSDYSNEELKSVINGSKYTKEAKETTRKILEGRTSKEELAEQKVDYQVNYLQQIANDVRTIKTIMLIFAIITGVSALITLISLIATTVH